METALRTIAWSMLLQGASIFAQPQIQWQKCLGGTARDEINAIQQTTDDGYIAVGFTDSDDGDVIGQHGNDDMWAVKLDTSGNVQWQRCLGGTGLDQGTAVRQTSDGGYVVLGYTGSNEGDVSGNHGGYDAWVVRLDADGILLWQRCLGGTQNEHGSSILQTDDDGFLVYADARSNDGDVSGHNGGIVDSWVVKLDPQGAIQWQKCLGGSAQEYAGGISFAADGGYLLAGYTSSNDSMVSGNHGHLDAWAMKLDTAGELLWQRCIGGTEADLGRAIDRNTGGCFVATTSESSNGDALCSHGPEDFLITRLDTTGGVQWHKCFGGTDPDLIWSICTTSGGGAVAAGVTHSDDVDVMGSHGLGDFWVVELDTSGMIQWQKCLGGGQYDRGKSVSTTNDGGYVVAGHTESNNGDVSGHHGGYDGWVVKLAPVGTAIAEGSTEDFDHFPDPADTEVWIMTGSISAFRELVLIDVRGRELLRSAIRGRTHVLDVSNLQPGLYILTLSSPEGNSSQRFMVE